MTETAEMQEAEPVAWQHRIWFDDTGSWSGWRDGRFPGDLGNSFEERALVLKSDFDAMRAQRDEATRLLKQVSLALESLTPSGSEYISHSKVLGTFYADADACCRFVKDQKADGHKARIEAVDERRRNADLKAQISRLREVLEEGRRAIGDHFAPNDCYATGPATGDPIRDLIECPACSFIGAYEAIVGNEANFCAPSEPSPSNSEDTP